MKPFNLTAITLLLLTACNSTPTKVEAPIEQVITSKEHTIQIPNDTKQLLVVTTANWSTKNGVLQRYEKIQNHWQKVGEPISIVLGRNGLGWGRGLHTIPNNAKTVKKEGDGKAPAGLFKLNNAFGYNSLTVDFPYEVYKTTDHCVDDSNSIWYNKIVDSTKTEKDYKSFEHMKLKNNLYQYGIVVNHNPDAIANAGSCIFMHIKSPTGNGTAGCTAMSKKKIVKVLEWLKEENKPLLLQLPKEEMVKVDLN